MLDWDFFDKPDSVFLWLASGHPDLNVEFVEKLVIDSKSDIMTKQNCLRSHLRNKFCPEYLPGLLAKFTEPYNPGQQRCLGCWRSLLSLTTQDSRDAWVVGEAC
ncbi:hypothetical protein COW36_03090 [bacterium (Candidatus Blackallbacteria) CG17_big_fil_post_rev_8_21_14_2_50_48_46]|uniref:Uncharacterized protein n=1 Tax=bacterium (Candidatus Blackallbacteria) CG17_big_fil_post_rev_8_21_14_2_50_48_46 TaxID=2014261 RepID=A0A2M7G9S1_9BACT|nr:MAG: hypothetical protein COW64_24500 [bacterium (Candidatus Blackallbacteria) CG18_big_fil_WC_8_21_14_2_50_49_26]PIW18879.1 MAG: hypothetical protein COW36_03090 [bacterium (Candidatus Blackallbacteria) CG17_big_fil_post_rev_8_21_14_2_50_48_46]PIW49963.1 MAG: hypothetical protein COW20_04070 [bacterium (Candidatus Blackallbacteria) CG13_big_fil_rev_8_21_14_2_50_49_14]